MGLKDLFLNKGGAGRALSREETIERLNPLLRRHHELNLAYNYALNTLQDRAAIREMNTLLKTARVDIAKLSETVLSAGGVSYNGTDLDPDEVNLGNADSDIVHRLKEMESDLEAAVADELDVDHQIRTKAILSLVLGNSRARLEFLRALAKKNRKATPAES